MTDYKKIAAELWQMLDDIDTYSDMAKDNNNAYRHAAEKKVKERFNLMQSDGYNLFIDGESVDLNDSSYLADIESNDGC